MIMQIKPTENAKMCSHYPQPPLSGASVSRPTRKIGTKCRSLKIKEQFVVYNVQYVELCFVWAQHLWAYIGKIQKHRKQSLFKGQK